MGFNDWLEANKQTVTFGLTAFGVIAIIAVTLHLIPFLAVFYYDYEMSAIGLQRAEDGWYAYTPPFLGMSYTADRSYAHDLRVAALNCFTANPSATMTCRALAPYQPQWKTLSAGATAHDWGAEDPYTHQWVNQVYGFDCSTNCNVNAYFTPSVTPPTVTPPPCLLTPSSCATGTHLYLEGCICVADTVPSTTPAPTATPTLYIPPILQSPTPTIPTATPTPQVGASATPMPSAGPGASITPTLTPTPTSVPSGKLQCNALEDYDASANACNFSALKFFVAMLIAAAIVGGGIVYFMKKKAS